MRIECGYEYLSEFLARPLGSLGLCLLLGCTICAAVDEADKLIQPLLVNGVLIVVIRAHSVHIREVFALVRLGSVIL